VRACTYPYLKAEFEQQRDHVRADGTQPDPRLAQIERLKAEVTRLRERLAATRAELDDAKIFRGQPFHGSRHNTRNWPSCVSDAPAAAQGRQTPSPARRCGPSPRPTEQPSTARPPPRPAAASAADPAP